MDIIHRGLYHPWRAIDRLHGDADAFSRLSRSPSPATGNVAEWVPAVDIKEEDGRLIIRADVPGVDAEDLVITMTGGVLSLQGTREAHSEDKAAGFRRTERIHGRFKRSFSLPDSADPNGIVADYQNGVLEITIPKREQPEPKRIEVKSG